MNNKIDVCACSKTDLLENEYSDRYEKELKNKNYLAVALYDEFTFWQECMAQSNERFYSLTEEEIWETIDKTIDDQEFTEEMCNCFDYYLSHNKKESEENDREIPLF